MISVQRSVRGQEALEESDSFSSSAVWTKYWSSAAVFEPADNTWEFCIKRKNDHKAIQRTQIHSFTTIYFQFGGLASMSEGVGRVYIFAPMGAHYLITLYNTCHPCCVSVTCTVFFFLRIIYIVWWSQILYQRMLKRQLKLKYLRTCWRIQKQNTRVSFFFCVCMV